MTKLEEARTREISRVLNFYHESFTQKLAVTIAYTETLPEEINNQIRDAFTHMARVQNADTQVSIKKEADLAVSHIERAIRDCLKASIIKAREELDDLIADAVFYHGFLTPVLKTSFDDLLSRRKEAYAKETRGDDDQIEKLDKILRLTMHLGDQIRSQYNVAGKSKTRFLRAAMRWFRPIGFLFALIVGTALGFILKSFIEGILAG